MKRFFVTFAVCFTAFLLPNSAHQAQGFATTVPPRALSIEPARPEGVYLAKTETTEAKFQVWLGKFRLRARKQGISAKIIETALTVVTYNAKIIALDRRQSDFTKTIAQYLDGAVSQARIRDGQKMLRKYATILASIEKKYKVDKEVVVAVWGLETSYGGFRGKSDIIRSLATLAFDGRRSAFFEAELLAALKILQNGDVTARGMRGSWAGAMGHTQFMPSSYLRHAVDFNGDGQRDIWSGDPTDALASTAAYLRNNGWKPGQPWAIEVRLPDRFNYMLSNPGVKKRPRAWARLGVKSVDGRAIKVKRRASIFLPAGADGPALMVFDNFDVIRSYNITPTYIMAVGFLSDALKGNRAGATSWPANARLLSLLERREMQALLIKAGFNPGRVDGKLDRTVILALQNYQAAEGLRPDGYPSPSILKRLRAQH